MAEFLKTHALDNVWCVPMQDRQSLIKLTRLTPDRGVRGYATVAWDTVPVPKTPVRTPWHIFQLGPLDPIIYNALTNVPTLTTAGLAVFTNWQATNEGKSVVDWLDSLSNSEYTLYIEESVSVNLEPVKNQWQPFDGICKRNNLVVDLITTEGVCLPRANSYIQLMNNNNVIIAVPLYPGYGEAPIGSWLDTGVLYARFYTNAYFDSNEWLDLTPYPEWPINVVGSYIQTPEDRIDFTGQVNTLKNIYGSLGQGLYFTNGFLTTEPVGAAWPDIDIINKYMEFVWDSSIKQIYVLGINDMPVFSSTLDEVDKFLYAPTRDYQYIDFLDDADFYLARTIGGVRKGVRIPHTSPSNIRHVTHNAYSIKVSLIESLVATHSFLGTVNDCEVIAVIRKPLMRRGLIQQHNRIEELYKLSTIQEIREAMVGVNATNNVWKAENLENSVYVKLFSKDDGEITELDVEEAYGYNALTRIFAEVVQIPEITANTAYVTLPDGLGVPSAANNRAHRRLYAYDNSGKLLSVFNQSGVYNVIPVDQVNGITPGLFEVFEDVSMLGTLTFSPFYHHGTTTYTDTSVVKRPLKENGFRVYACALVGGVPNEQWVDITGNTSYYTYTEATPIPTLTWDAVNLVNANLYPCVRIGNGITHYQQTFDAPYQGIVKLSVTETVRWQGALQNRIQNLQPANLDLWMDGYPLIDGIDYHVIWPDIVIVRRPARTTDEGLEVLVRHSGWPDPDTMEYTKPHEVGFVKGGILSVNGQYDIRNDRNIRVVVADRLRHRNHVRFAEDDTGLLTTDGLPYSITDYVTGVEHYTSKDTVDYRQASLTVDTDTANYLGAHLTPTVPPTPVVIANRWEVVSPLISRILHALVNEGFLNAGQLDVPYNNLQVDGWIDPYLYLLNFDPGYLGVDTEYVFVRPHQYDTPMVLSVKQYEFVEYVISHYLTVPIDLTPFITIGP